MSSKPLAVVLLVIACGAAAAGSAYVAVRQNAPSSAEVGAPLTPATAVSAAVQETEALVAPAAVPFDSSALEPVERTSGPTAAGPSAPRVAVTTLRPARVVTEKPRRRGPGATPAANPSPSRSAVNTAPPASSSAPESVATPRGDTVVPSEPAHRDPVRVEPPPPPPVEFVELVIPSASVIGLQIETPVSTERANLEDRVDARVMRDVAVDGRTAIPAGTRALGAVTLVERGGKVKERARLGVRFHTLVLADGTQLPIRTDAILREGDSPTGESAAKIGGAAVGGAILGALMGGKKGAIMGGATGAAGGTAVVMTGGRNAATLAAGAIVTVRLSTPVAVEVERR